ncbi:hypothetical protein LCGC14_0791130 [marine sediment metagenome]|uniref:Uncharacterized protein n=1 Tax=marine sediment metagenome TaxID=412755 RepID=A0A0F9SCF2_9ZZZZ
MTDKKFKCSCGYEDDNEANFDYHQEWCTRQPRRSPLRPNQFQYDQPRGSLTEDWGWRWRFRLNKAAKVMLGIILVSFILYLLSLLW